MTKSHRDAESIRAAKDMGLIGPGTVVRIDPNRNRYGGCFAVVVDTVPVLTAYIRESGGNAFFVTLNDNTYRAAGRAEWLPAWQEDQAKMQETDEAVWCVKHSDGWCATRSGRQYREGECNIRTKCKLFITCYLGCEKRRPTCPQCLTALKKGKGSSDESGPESSGRIHTNWSSCPGCHTAHDPDPRGGCPECGATMMTKSSGEW